MFLLYANENQLSVHKADLLTSGSVNVYQVQFQFSPDWDGLTKTAIFRAGTESRSVLLDDSGLCTIPWEVLTAHERRLTAGVCGTRGGSVVLPTIWSSLGIIREGATVGEDARPPTLELWQQELAGKGDTLRYTDDGKLGLYAGAKLLSSVGVSTSAGGVDIATDEEVEEMLDEVFGPAGEDAGRDVATDEEINEMLDEVFGPRR